MGRLGQALHCLRRPANASFFTFIIKKYIYIYINSPFLSSLHPSSLVKERGEGRWSDLAIYFPGRVGKQCRERWHNQLRPNINRVKKEREKRARGRSVIPLF